MKLILFRHPIWIPGLLGAALALSACTLGQRPPGDRMCTLIGCGPSLEIMLVGDYVPTDFTMGLASPSGKLLSVRCTEGTAHFDPPEAALWSPACPAGGVSFQALTPEQLTVSVNWSEGEVTQDFNPVYLESSPNGPGCEPTCRTARLEVRIPSIPAYGDVSAWQTYRDEVHGFSVRYPAALALEYGPQVDGHRIVFVGEKIQIHTSAANPLVCQGECPVIESTEPASIAGRDAYLVRGYIGSIGGNIPQHFMLYLIRSGSTYISLVLYAESRHAALVDPGVILSLKEADLQLFDRMVATLEMPH